MREAIIAACRRLRGYLKHTHTHMYVCVYIYIFFFYTHMQREVIYFDFKVLLLSRNKAYLIPVRGGGLRCIMETKEKRWANIQISKKFKGSQCTLAGNVIFLAFSCVELDFGYTESCTPLTYSLIRVCRQLCVSLQGNGWGLMWPWPLVQVRVKLEVAADSSGFRVNVA